MSTPGLWDAGAQPERTALAWSRTALSATGLLAVLVRVLSSEHPVIAVALAAAGLAATVSLGVLARGRYARASETLGSGRGLPGAGVPLAGAAVAAVTGVAALLHAALP